MPRTGIQPLDELRERNNQHILDIKPTRDQKHVRHMTQLKDVTAKTVDELAIDAGSLFAGSKQVEITAGQITALPLNYYNVYSTVETPMTPVLSLPRGSISNESIVEILISGEILQQTGGNQTTTFKAYLGAAGAETQVGAGIAPLYTSSSVPVKFFYRIFITQAARMGNYVKVEEEFTWYRDAASGGGVMGGSTETLLSTASLDDAISFYMSMTMGLAYYLYSVKTNKMRVQFAERPSSTEYRFISTNFDDTLINSGNPATNYGSSTLLNVGEHNTLTERNRSILKCLDLVNIPQNARIVSASLFLTLSGELSSNATQIQAKPIFVPWTEAGATWNTEDGSTAWPVGSFPGDGSPVIGSFNLAAVESTGKVFRLDFDPAEFQKWVDGTLTDYGIVLYSAAELNDLYQFYSSESGAPPLLYVVYTLN